MGNAPLGAFRECMQLGGGNLSFTGGVLWCDKSTHAS